MLRKRVVIARVGLDLCVDRLSESNFRSERDFFF